MKPRDSEEVFDRSKETFDRSIVEAQLAHTLDSVTLPLPGERLSGKVRDSYVQGDRRILIASDRLSAFDVILTTIPFKGQILTEMAMHWFSATEHIVPNHVISHPHPNVMITKEVRILPVEVIVRGYLAGSAWRDYAAGRAVSGIQLPKGLKKSQRLAEPLITPSTKAEQGEHDMPISREEILSSGLVERSVWEAIERTALQLFDFGSKKAAERGLILVDTKYELGLLRTPSGTDELILADEVHTPDSSRYWMLDSYEKRFAAGDDPVHLSKEFVREWLLEQGWMGDGPPPTLPDSFRVDTALRYIEAFELMTGTEFRPETGPVAEKIGRAIASYLHGNA